MFIEPSKQYPLHRSFVQISKPPSLPLPSMQNPSHHHRHLVTRKGNIITSFPPIPTSSRQEGTPTQKTKRFNKTLASAIKATQWENRL